MEPARGIKITIDTGAVRDNIAHLKQKYTGYKYYMAVVKANAYGHGLDARLTSKIIEGGADYLVVCWMDDALKLRQMHPDFPILVLNPAEEADILSANEHNITITADSVDSAERIAALAQPGLKVHIKVDTGLHRFGVMDRDELNEMYRVLSDSKAEIEGIYTHLVSEEDVDLMDGQIDLFFDLCADIPLSDIPIVHIPSGEALTVLPKKEKYAPINGTRMGSVIYGMIDESVGVKDAFTATARITLKRYVKKGETIGYQGCYTAERDEILGMLPIGYEMGFLRGYKQHFVYAQDTPCPVVGSVFMCQTYVRIPDSVQVGESVEIFRDFAHICSLSKKMNTIPEEILLALKPTMVEYK